MDVSFDNSLEFDTDTWKAILWSSRQNAQGLVSLIFGISGITDPAAMLHSSVDSQDVKMGTDYEMALGAVQKTDHA